MNYRRAHTRSHQQHFWLILALLLDRNDFICVEMSVTGGINLLGMNLYHLDTINFFVHVDSGKFKFLKIIVACGKGGSIFRPLSYDVTILIPTFFLIVLVD